MFYCTGEHDPAVEARNQLVAMVYAPIADVRLRDPSQATFVPVEGQYLCSECQTAFALKDPKALARFTPPLQQAGGVDSYGNNNFVYGSLPQPLEKPASPEGPPPEEPPP